VSAGFIKDYPASLRCCLSVKCVLIAHEFKLPAWTDESVGSLTFTVSIVASHAEIEVRNGIQVNLDTSADGNFSHVAFQCFLLALLR